MSAPHDPAGDLQVIQADVPPPSRLNDSIVLLTGAFAAVCGVGFGVALLLGAPLTVYGGLLALGLLLLGTAIRRYFTDRFPDVEALEPRVLPESPAGDDDEPIAGVAPLGPRRSFLKRALIASGALFGIGVAAPPIASLGPSPEGTLRRTAWAPGVRLVTTDGQPLRPEDVAAGGVASVWPQGAIGEERSAVLLLRLTDAPVAPTVGDWVVDAQLVAYSKVCTHAGCPVALYRERDNALFCPCHQSTFAPARGAVPTFGPAARALPQLPLGVNDEGYLIALDDFQTDVGPAAG